MKILTGENAIEWSHVHEEGTHEDIHWQKGH
jgi:hypothetical protein